MAVRIDRNARPLIGLVVLLVALGALMVIGKTYTPRLGLDLQGGTMITLTASTAGGGQVTTESLEQARQIIQKRVDSLGVGESEVTTNSNNQITVAVPNVQQDELVRLVGTTAQLTFRAVYVAEPVAPPVDPSASPSGSANPSANPSGDPSTNPSGSQSPSESAGPSGGQTAGPSASPTGNGRPFLPGLPPAPPTPTPTAGGSTNPSGEPSAAPTGAPSVEPGSVNVDEVLTYQPTDADYQAYLDYTCGTPVKDEPTRPIAACNREATEKYLLGPALIDGKQLTGANAGIPQNQVNWVVNLTFNDQGGRDFEKVTGILAAKTDPMNRFAVTLDGAVVSAPSVSNPIPGGSAEISGNFTASSARDLANVLKYGALPLTFQTSSVDNISAVLGGEQLRAGIIAGIIGLILVIGFCFLYYRGLGIVVVLSLIVAGALTYAIMSLLGASVGFALNLPGIAGAIVAIGLTADSFIIYFERIRDEVRDGRSLRSAVETGWRRARRTVLIADSVSLLSAVVLFVLAIGAIKGFAFTLGLTTAVDIAVMFWFTKPCMSLLARTRFYGGGHKLSGLDPAHFGVSILRGRGTASGTTAKKSSSSRRAGSTLATTAPTEATTTTEKVSTGVDR